MNKALKILGAILGLLLIIVIALPFALEKRVINFLIEDVEGTTHQLTFDRLDVKMLSSFPRLQVEIDNLGLNASTDSLLIVKEIEAKISMWQLLVGELDILAVEGQGGILKYQMTDSAFCLVEDFSFKVQGNIDTLNMSLAASSVDYTTSGFSVGGMPLDLSFSSSYNKAIEAILLGDNRLVIGKEELIFAGSIFIDEVPIVDLTFESPQSDITSLLNFIPEQWVSNLDTSKLQGQVVLDGFVKGAFVSDTCLPAFGMNLQVLDGYLQYQDKPQAIDEIALASFISHKDSTSLDATLIKVKSLSCKSGDNYINGTMELSQPITGVSLKGNLKGELDLKSLSQVFPMDAKELVGIVKSNVSFDGLLSDLAQENYQDFNASGKMTIQGYYLKSKSIPQGLNIKNAALEFTPEKIHLHKLNGVVGTSDLQLKGYLKDYFSYLFDDKPLKGELYLNSTFFNLNEFFVSNNEEGKEVKVAEETKEPASASHQSNALEIPGDLAIICHTNLKKVLLDKVVMSNCKGDLQLVDSRLELKGMAFNALDGHVKVDGQYNSKSIDALFADLNLEIKEVDVEQAKKQLSAVKKILPPQQVTEGKLSSTMSYYTQFTSAGKINKASVKSEGNITSKGLHIANNPSLNKLAKQLKDERYKDVNTGSVSVDYQFANEKLTIKPFDLQLVDKKVTAGGWYETEGQISLKIRTTVKAKEIGGDVSKYVAMISDANKPLPVTLLITGDAKNPQVKYDTREAISVIRKDMTKKLNKDALNSVIKGLF